MNDADAIPVRESDNVVPLREDQPSSPTEMMERANEELLAQLAEIGASVPDTVMLQMQLHTMVELLFPEGGDFRDVYNYALEVNMNRFLTTVLPQAQEAKAQAEAEARRQALTEGIQFAPPQDVV